MPSSPNGPCSSGKTTSTCPSSCGGWPGLEDGQRGLARRQRQHDVGGARLDLGRAPGRQLEAARVVGGEDPLAVARDADRHDVVLARGRSRAAPRRRWRTRRRARRSGPRRRWRRGGDARGARCGMRHRPPAGPAGLQGWSVVIRRDSITPRDRPDPRLTAWAPKRDCSTSPPRHLPRLGGAAASATPGAPGERPRRAHLDVCRRRPRQLRPLGQPDVERLRGGARRARGRACPRARLRHGGHLGGPLARAARRHGGGARHDLQRHRRPARGARGGRRHGRPQYTPATRPASSRPSTAADLLWLESPTNPLMDVMELDVVLARRAGSGVTSVVDNTLSTPLLLPAAVARRRRRRALRHEVPRRGTATSCSARPSCRTRTGAREIGERLRRHRTLHGAIAGPMEVYLALRGLRTLAGALRAGERQRGRAGRAARGPPGRRAGALPRGRRDAVDRRRGRRRGCRAGLRRNALWLHSTSLGGVESQLERRRRHPSEPEQVPDNLLRLSVGIEHVDDLWADLDQALRAAL